MYRTGVFSIVRMVKTGQVLATFAAGRVTSLCKQGFQMQRLKIWRVLFRGRDHYCDLSPVSIDSLILVYERRILTWRICSAEMDVAMIAASLPTLLPLFRFLRKQGTSDYDLSQHERPTRRGPRDPFPISTAHSTKFGWSIQSTRGIGDSLMTRLESIDDSGSKQSKTSWRCLDGTRCAHRDESQLMLHDYSPIISSECAFSGK